MLPRFTFSTFLFCDHALHPHRPPPSQKPTVDATPAPPAAEPSVEAAAATDSASLSLLPRDASSDFDVPADRPPVNLDALSLSSNPLFGGGLGGTGLLIGGTATDVTQLQRLSTQAMSAADQVVSSAVSDAPAPVASSAPTSKLDARRPSALKQPISGSSGPASAASPTASSAAPLSGGGSGVSVRFDVDGGASARLARVASALKDVEAIERSFGAHQDDSGDEFDGVTGKRVARAAKVRLLYNV